MENKTPDQIVIDALNNKDMIVSGKCGDVYLQRIDGRMGFIWSETYRITNRPDSKNKSPEYEYFYAICKSPIGAFEFKLSELKSNGQLECLYESNIDPLISRETYRKLSRRARTTAMREWVDVKKQNINTIVQQVKARLSPTK